MLEASIRAEIRKIVIDLAGQEWSGGRCEQRRRPVKTVKAHRGEPHGATGWSLKMRGCVIVLSAAQVRPDLLIKPLPRIAGSH